MTVEGPFQSVSLGVIPLKSRKARAGQCDGCPSTRPCRTTQPALGHFSLPRGLHLHVTLSAAASWPMMILLLPPPYTAAVAAAADAIAGHAGFAPACGLDDGAMALIVERKCSRVGHIRFLFRTQHNVSAERAGHLVGLDHRHIRFVNCSQDASLLSPLPGAFSSPPSPPAVATCTNMHVYSHARAHTTRMLTPTPGLQSNREGLPFVDSYSVESFTYTS